MEPTREFVNFCEEVDSLYTSWTLWHRLFGEGSSREDYDTMRAASELTFQHVSWEMLRAAVIDIGRLCGDPIQSRGRDNLTLERVFDAADFTGRPDVEDHTRRAMEESQRIARSGEMKTLRNRVIAHNDLQTATGVASFPRVPPGTVDDAVRWIADFRYRVAAAVNGTPFDIRTGEGMGPPAELRERIEEEAANLLDVLRRGTA